MAKLTRAFVVQSPRCIDVPLAVFADRKDAMTYFGDLYPTRGDAAEHVREVPAFLDGYLGYQHRKDARE